MNCLKIAFKAALVINLVTLIFIGAILTAPVYAFNSSESKVLTTFLKETKLFKLAVSDEVILELAKVAEKPGGTKEVGLILGKINLPNEALEDAFARILVAQGRAQRHEVDGWMQRLSGTKGFRSAMRKSMGASPAKTAGHLNEVRIADSAAQNNMKVKEIGARFDDGMKKAPTDIDVLLEHRGREIAIEAKEYLPTTPIPLDSFRADIVSLAQYRRANPNANVLPIFWLTNKPNDASVWKLLEAAAEQHKVELIVGSPSEAIHQIPLLF